MRIRRDQSARPSPLPRRMVWTMTALVATALPGCSTVSTRFVTGLSAEERAQAAELPVYRRQAPETTHRRVGPVEGFSCQITRDDSYEVSEANAVKEIQRATVKAGGDAVIDVSCEELRHRESARGCFRSVVCRGTAVRFAGSE